jgi:hypothetical protein
MSNNIYDILGKLDGLTPKANPVSTAEPIYESVDPRGDIISAVTQLEERFAGFKEAKTKTKRKEPQAVIPATDLTRSADPDVARLATKAKFIKPELNDFEAIVSYTSKLEKELDQAEKADIVDRQKIEQTQGMLAKTQANQDAMQKVLTAADQRFRALNAKVASGQVTQQDQKAAQAAQQIEKDTDTAKAAVAKNATAPEQPTTAPEIPQNTSVWDNVPDADKKSRQSADATGAQGASNASGDTGAEETPNRYSGLAANQEKYDLDAFDDKPELKAAAESMVKEAGIFDYAKNLINPAEKPQPPTDQTPAPSSVPRPTANSQPTEYARWNNQEFNAMKADPNLAAVELLYPKGSKVRINRATYDKLKSAFAKITDPALKKSIVVNVLSDSNQLRTYVDQIEHELPAPPPYQVGQTTTTAPGGKEYRYFYDNVGPTEVGKAYNLGLKANPQGRWYSSGQENPEATKIWGKPKALLVSPPRGKLAGTQLESLGKNKMTKPTSIIEAVRSVEYKKLKEAAKPDFLDLDKDGDTDEPMKSAAKTAKDHEPAKPDSDAVAKRKRLQALKDKQEDERAEKGDDDKSSSRFVKGRAYGGAAQKDDEEKDLDESGLQAYLGKKKYGKEGMKALQQAGREGASKETMAKLRARHDKFDESAKPDYIDLDKDGNKTEPMKKAAKDAKHVDEVAPPGAKAERMVKGIKQSLSKDGHLSGKDKAIAYATTWKARKKGQVEEATEFKDTVKNSKAELKKHKMVKEGRNPESSEYTYETVGRILSDEQPGLDANSEAFVKAVYDELIEMKMTPKAARWLVHYDEDFISDCATSYGHFCLSKEKEAMECGSPTNAFVSEEPLIDAQQELDEIARLAGLTRENYNQMAPSDSASPLTYAGCPKCNADPCCCEDEKAMDEGMGCSEDELNEAATRKDFRMVADLLKSIPDMAKRTELAMYHADIFKQQNPRFKKEMFLVAAGVDTTPIKDIEDDVLVGEADVGEGNEFSGALAAAKASGAKEFNVDGKKYTVKEDINVNVSANGEEDVVNLIRKLSGMEAIKTVTDKISAMSGEACGACGSAPCGCESLEEDGSKEREIEYTNSPREVVAGTDAAIPAGADLNRAKKQYKKEYPGDNPMAVAEAKEAALWKAYETMINDIKV